MVEGKLISDTLFLAKGWFAYDAICITDTNICERNSAKKVIQY